MYRLRLDEEAAKIYQKADARLAKRLNRCFERLQEDPYRHPNIKTLKGELGGLRRYRLGDWRLIYEVDEDQM